MELDPRAIGADGVPNLAPFSLFMDVYSHIHDIFEMKRPNELYKG